MSNHQIVTFNKITKEYPGVVALSDISFGITKGSVHGFIGPNGAGKSTTMKILAGLIPHSGGELLFNNENIQNLRDRSRITYLPEMPALYLGMKVNEYLCFIYEIYFKKKICSKHLDHSLELCGLADVKNRLINHLSKGFKQKVGIAQSLIVSPELIILDEPTVGLDPIAQVELRELILNLKKNHTIFLSSHILHDVSIICDEITLINKGRIIKSGPMDQLIQSFSDKHLIQFSCKNWNLEHKNIILDHYACEMIEQSTSDVMNVSCTFEQDIKEDLFLKFLIENNFKITEFKKYCAKLEDVFFKVNK